MKGIIDFRNYGESHILWFDGFFTLTAMSCWTKKFLILPATRDQESRVQLFGP
jgi:hypothetical protein